ncbi:MAG TPA: MFS transporter [Aggregatilineales bacterium]|nr:MFS transporter [Aggregatilineales bacterium]
MELALEKTRTRATRRERWAWYLYDFGDSAYASVILLAVFAVYFKDTVVGGAAGSRVWGLSIGVAMLVVAVISPVLGAIADYSGSKKRVMFIFTAISVTFTALLFFVRQGDVLMGAVFFILAEIGYRGAQVFYNALLPEIASEEEMGRVSGNGWAIGSAGGLVILVLVLPLIVFIGGQFVTRLAFVITALFYALSTLPALFWLNERAAPKQLPAGENYLTVAFKQLARTARQVRHFREFIKFLIAFLIFNDGILMALDFAAIFGAVMFGMSQEQLIILIMVLSVSSVAGAYLFGLLADSLGSKRSLILALVLMILAVVLILFARSITAFFLLGSLAGFALTGVQSVSRTVIGQFSPPGQSAEFYGFFSVAGRTSSFIGPTIYGLLAAGIAHRFQAEMGAIAAEQLGQRIAMLSVAGFLLAGLVLLFFVNEERARAAAQLAAATD